MDGMKNWSIDSKIIKLSVVMFVFGFFLSLSFGFFSGASLWTIFLRALFSGLTMLALALVLYFVLDVTIPEVKELLPNSQSKKQEEEAGFSDIATEDLRADDLPLDNTSDQDEKNNPPKESYTPQITEKMMKESKKNKKVAEDEILVEGVAIKKDPELMKNAMRQVLDQDE